MHGRLRSRPHPNSERGASRYNLTQRPTQLRRALVCFFPIVKEQPIPVEKPDRNAPHGSLRPDLSGPYLVLSPPAPQAAAGALAGGAGRDRTDDPLLAKQVLSQLSYSPAPCLKPRRTPILVGLDGFEPSTPALSRRCSNQLSYRPVSGPAGANCRPAVVTTVASQPISVNTGTTGWFRERR
jgi:hypothetical protein